MVRRTLFTCALLRSPCWKIFASKQINHKTVIERFSGKYFAENSKLIGPPRDFPQLFAEPAAYTPVDLILLPHARQQKTSFALLNFTIEGHKSWEWIPSSLSPSPFHANFSAASTVADVNRQNLLSINHNSTANNAKTIKPRIFFCAVPRSRTTSSFQLKTFQLK